MHAPVTSPGRKASRLDPEPSAYLTDGSRLFRVITGFGYPPENNRATLEDCATLEVCSYSPDEIWSMGLRLVQGSKTHSTKP